MYRKSKKLDILHKYLVKTHPDILTEKEKKEVKFYWTWDYFTLKDVSKATYVKYVKKLLVTQM